MYTKLHYILPIIILAPIFGYCQSKQLMQLLDTAHSITQAKALYEQYYPEGYQPGAIVESHYKHFNRWYWHQSRHLMPDGSLPNKNYNYEAYQQFAQQRKVRSTPWLNVSATAPKGGYWGIGRLTSVAFHPSDSNIMYVSAPKGGVFKTTNYGLTWQAIGDGLPTLACGKVVIDPNNANTLYVTLNDRPGWWLYGLGIYKSTDAGLTWQATGAVYNFSDETTIYDLQIAKSNSQVLWNATNKGLYKTTDGGTTWTQVLNKSCTQIELMPGNDSVVYVAVRNYAGGLHQVVKSTDMGNTFTQASSFTNACNEIQLAVSAANSNAVYAFRNFNGYSQYWRSNDAGQSFIQLDSLQSHDYVIASALNQDRVYAGNIDVHLKASNSVSFNKISNWYNDGVLPEVHADVRHIAINPLTPHKIFFCNDGGLYSFDELANKFKDLSGTGLVISQFYKMAVAQTDSNYIIAGSQDNGGWQMDGNYNWTHTNGGDAMEQGIASDNEQTIFTTYVDGELFRSYDRWTGDTYFEITPNLNDKGAWITPYQLHPQNPMMIVAGYSDVYTSTDQGGAWNKISNNLTGSNNNNITALALAPSNINCVYAGWDATLKATHNLGTTWRTLAVATGGIFESISNIAVHPYSDSTVYICKSGYGHNRQVLKSTKGGSNFVNISHNLPQVPINCIAIDAFSDSNNVDMYVATDMGVFYKADADTTWQYYGTGLPNTECTDLEIHYATGKLYVSTYGRGVYVNKIKRPVSNTNVSIKLQSTTPPSWHVSYANGLINVHASNINASQAVIKIFNSNGTLVSAQQLNGNHRQYSHTLSTGIYVAQLVVGGKSYHQKILVP
jgi:photosystem II stability/assembly factor-like uncharacterized protein